MISEINSRLRPTNPALNEKYFKQLYDSDQRMDFNSILLNTIILLAFFIMSMPIPLILRAGNVDISNICSILVFGVVMAIITFLFRTHCWIFAPIFVSCLGFFMSMLAATVELNNIGFAFRPLIFSVLLLFILCVFILLGVISLKNKLIMGIFAILMVIFLSYPITFCFSYLFQSNILYFHHLPYLQLLFNIFVLIAATFAYIVDINFVKKMTSINMERKY